MFISILFYQILLVGVLGREPDCQVGSPLVYKPDLNGRCDRYWECEDGFVAEMGCLAGMGYDERAMKCHENAPCMKKSQNSGSAGVFDLDFNKSLRMSLPFDKIMEVGTSIFQAGTSLILPVLLSKRDGQEKHNKDHHHEGHKDHKDH